MGNLNQNQRVVIWIAVALIALSFLFPHWEYYYPSGLLFNSKYQFLFSPPAAGSRQYTLDITRLLVQVLIIAGVAFGAIVALKEKNDNNNRVEP
jgi:hypothetical protein